MKIKRLLLLLVALAATRVPSMATWTRVQTQGWYCGDSTNTCAVSLGTATTAGHLLVAVLTYNDSASNITASTGSGSGTWVHPASCNARATGLQAVDWMYTLSATAGSSITITMSGTAQALGMTLFEYAGTGPLTYDTCAIVNGGTAYTNPPAGSITTTGTNDMAMAAIYGGAIINSGSAVSPSPWTTPIQYGYNDNIAFDDALNFGPTTTQAIFTATSSGYPVGSTIAFKETSAATTVRKRVNTFWRLSDAFIGGGGGTDFAAQIAPDIFAATDVASQTSVQSPHVPYNGFYPAANEANPHGVPAGWGFDKAAVFSLMNNTVDPTVGQEKALEPWGTVYVQSSVANDVSPAPNTRVNIGGCTIAWKPTSGSAWVVRPLLTSEMDDANYPEDWSAGGITADFRTETDGTFSVTAGKTNAGDAVGYVNHFNAPFPRLCMTNATTGSGAAQECTTPGSTYGGVVVVCKARLILANPAGTDDRALAKYVINIGADPYPTMQGSGIENNPSIGGSKYKIVTNNWRSIGFSTFTEAQLRANPPSIDLTGLSP